MFNYYIFEFISKIIGVPVIFNDCAYNCGSSYTLHRSESQVWHLTSVMLLSKTGTILQKSSWPQIRVTFGTFSESDWNEIDVKEAQLSVDKFNHLPCNAHEGIYIHLGRHQSAHAHWHKRWSSRSSALWPACSWGHSRNCTRSRLMPGHN